MVDKKCSPFWTVVHVETGERAFSKPEKIAPSRMHELDEPSIGT
jgi:hypothetical protein